MTYAKGLSLCGVADAATLGGNRVHEFADSGDGSLCSGQRHHRAVDWEIVMGWLLHNAGNPPLLQRSQTRRERKSGPVRAAMRRRGGLFVSIIVGGVGREEDEAAVDGEGLQFDAEVEASLWRVAAPILVQRSLTLPLRDRVSSWISCYM